MQNRFKSIFYTHQKYKRKRELKKKKDQIFGPNKVEFPFNVYVISTERNISVMFLQVICFYNYLGLVTF